MGEQFFNMRKMALYILCGSISLSQIGYAEPASASPKEALMLRRITEYWKDGDYSTVKRQIIDFLEKNPDTSLHDHLHAMLGDLYFQDKQYRQALATYDLIGNAEVREKTFFNRLQAEFEARDFLSVIESADRYLKEHRGTPLETKVRYLLAESYFRHALKCKDLEQKIHYLKLAKPQYKVLTQSKFSERVLFPLAEIHRLLREDDRAASLYISLAEKYPEHRERFLFQSAILQIKLDKDEAQRTFARVHDMGGKRSKLAAFNRLILLYQLERYPEFLSFYQTVIDSMPDQKVPLLKFYEGRCIYSMGDYGGAVLPLEEFVTSAKGQSKELKTAYLLLVNCSRYTKDIALLERTLYSFKSAFPKALEVPKVLMIHSQMCRENGDFTQALSDLQTLVSDYPKYSDAEAVAYDYALLLSQTDKWIEAREKFLTFVQKYPNSERHSAAWRHLLNCCIEEIKNPSTENADESKETFVIILQRILQEDHVLTAKEKQQYTLVMMKCQCELERYVEVIPFLSQYIADTSDHDFLAEAHLLMAICMQKTSSDHSQFIQNAEQALVYNNHLPERDLLHLELYNAYLSQSLVISDDRHEGLLKKAAENLFASGAWKKRAIKLDNYLWLTDHFYKRAKQGERESFDNASILFSDLLGLGSGSEHLNISSDSLYLEAEVLKYSHLLAIYGKLKDRVELLEKLVDKQTKHSGLPWKLKKRCMLELGRAYEENHRLQDALKTYRHLVKTGDRSASIVNSGARLYLAKLEYQLLKRNQRNSDSPELIPILHTLKDLQIQKKLQAEPLHLEAALQYAEIRLGVADPKDHNKDALFFYKRMFDDFHSKEDPIAAEYNHLREEHPEKDAIFQAYMQYIDSQILKTQAIIARSEKKEEKAVECEETALRILNCLLEKEETLRPFLYDRVNRAKAELTKQV